MILEIFLIPSAMARQPEEATAQLSIDPSIYLGAMDRISRNIDGVVPYLYLVKGLSRCTSPLHDPSNLTKDMVSENWSCEWMTQ
jgi:hypothetical protein